MMKITSPAFTHNTQIPAKYTCDGENINPPLEFSGIPQNTKSLVLIVDDPDAPAGIWDHWVIYNILPTVTIVFENSIPQGCIQGLNSSGKASYEGPCPPGGKHRYFFKLYALNVVLELKGDIYKKDVEQAMRSNILEEAQLIGLYSRR